MGQESEPHWGRLGVVRGRLGRPGRLVGEIGGDAFEIVLGGPRHGDCRISPAPFASVAFPPLRREPTSRLLARLDGDGSTGATRAAARIRARLAPVTTLAFLRGAFPEWGGAELRAYDARRASGRRALAIAGADPALARVLPGRVGPFTRRADLLAALGPDGRRCDPGHEARVLALGWSFEAAETLRALLDLPWDWVPRAPEERASFDRIVRAAAPLMLLLGSHAALRAGKGRWRDYEDLLRRRSAAPDLASACRAACDMARAFADQVAAPLLAVAGLSRGQARPYRPEPAVAPAATRVLFGGKGLAAILEASADWHQRQGEIEVEIGAIGQGRGLSWPLPFPGTRSPEGLRLVPIATREELRREGAPLAEGGLAHCVGGYGRACAEGRAVVVAIGDGDRRLSTLELDLSGAEPRIVQHKSAGNAVPMDRDRRAATWLLESLRRGSVRVSPAWRDPAWRRRERIRLDDVCGYDWADPEARGVALRAWGPHVVRPLREVGALGAALAAAAGGMAAGPDGTWYGPLPTGAVGGARPVRARMLAILRAPVDLGVRLGSAAEGRARRAGATAAASIPVLACALAAGPGPLAGPAMLAGWAVAGIAMRRAWAQASAGSSKIDAGGP